MAERIGRWASLSTSGAEPTGIYFDKFNPNRAFLNVQHATSDVDRTIVITATPSNPCQVCHKGRTYVFSCGSAEYQRHIDHGDSAGACR